MKENNNIPKGFKSSPLGPIPVDWDILHFEDVAEIDKVSLPGSTDKKYRFRYISLSDVDSDVFKIETTEQVFESAPSRARRIVRKGDVLMSTVRPNLQGFSIIREGAKDLIASTGFAVITPQNCNNEFLYHSLFGQTISKQFYQLLVGSNYPAINSSDVRKLRLPFPSNKEQIAIGTLLSTWDKAINTVTQLITQKELRKKWLMQQLLTGRKKLKGFKGEWVKFHYHELLQTVKRPIEWNDKELYHLISVRRRSGGIFEREPLYGHQIMVKNLRTTNMGDFLFSKMQIVHGASALVTKEFNGSMISGSYIAVNAKDKKKLDIGFFDWYSKTPYFYHQTYISSYGVHIEKMTFDFENFLTLDMKLPSIEEQQAIVKVLQSSVDEIALLNRMLDRLKDQKKGLMQILLTGKKRLKQ